MIIFLFGEDTYRAKEKLEEIIDGYKKVNKSGLNLIHVNAFKNDFKEIQNSLKTVSMFAEKKLIILKNVFTNTKFQEDFLKELKNIEALKDIVVVFEEQTDKRTKFFKALEKETKCQEFNLLSGLKLQNWVAKELEKNNAKMDLPAQNLLLQFAGNDLWKLSNEIKKLANYKNSVELGDPPKLIKKEDVEKLVKPNVENDIFKTIDALAQKDKKQALDLLRKHIESGENPLYLLSMTAFQFRNLLIVKELVERRMLFPVIQKKSCLHPFVAKKSYFMCSKFSFEELKKIYLKIFQIDLDIKIGKIDPELALDLFVASI